jgi:hypothetical protein
MTRRLIILILFIICILVVLYLLFSWWIALTVGLLIIGTIGYLEKIFNIEIPKILRILLLSLFILLSVSNLIYSKYKENSIRQELQNAKDATALYKGQISNIIENNSNLQKKLKEAQDNINALSEYGEVSTYTFYGDQQSGQWLSPFTPVSKWTEGYLTVTNNLYYFKRTPDAIRHYKDLIKKCPKFPFPYLALSQSLKNNGDPSWKQYAIKAQSIMRKTTKIPLHSKDHDGWLEQVNKILDPNQMNSVIIRGNIHKSEK